MKLTKLLLAVAAGALITAGTATAQNDEADTGPNAGETNPAVPINRGAPDLNGQLFVGTSTNVNDPAGAANDVFSVDPVSGSNASIFSGVGVWGATADPANSRILFTRASGLTPPAGQIGGGDELFSVPYSGGAPVSLGRLLSPTGIPVRMDGLAISGGVLYGYNAGAGADNGMWSIDIGTLTATQISTTADSISGLDADPDTGIIYGVNDTTASLVSLDTMGNITTVVAYPAGYTDVDGLAVGNGFAYLVTDESQDIQVYDLVGGSYGSTLTSPFATPDTFSAAAFAVAGTPPVPVIIPTMGTVGLVLLALALLAAGVVATRRRVKA